MGQLSDRMCGQESPWNWSNEPAPQPRRITTPTHPMTKDELIAYFSRRTWTFAKTMPRNPHEYIAVQTSPDDDARKRFCDAVVTLRAYGVKKKHGSATYTYFIHEGYQYWTMGAPVEKTIIINRARVWDAYNALADGYDAAYDNQECKEQNSRLGQVLRPHLQAGSILDIGCGTGLAIRILDTPPEDYHGLDPSSAMLAKLKERHPHHGTTCDSLDGAAVTGHSFRNVISLFGAMSYVMPRFLSKPLSYTNGGGKLFLMFYKPGYRPAYSDDNTMPHDHSAEFLAGIYGVQPCEFDNFLIFAR